MLKSAKWLLVAVAFLSTLFLGRAAQAATYSAASCNFSDVQAAFTAQQAKPANGDIISIPAGTCTWNNTLPKYTATTSLTVQGQTTISGACYPTACTATDNTTIICGSGCTIVFDISWPAARLR